jgi:transcriptional regulator with XRE-family HTH domain
MTSKQVKQIRAALGLTLEELGRAMLVSWTTVWRWENGYAEKMDPLRRLVLEEILAEISSRTAKQSGEAAKRWARLAGSAAPAQFVAEALFAVGRRQMRRRAEGSAKR